HMATPEAAKPRGAARISPAIADHFDLPESARVTRRQRVNTNPTASSGGVRYANVTKSTPTFPEGLVTPSGSKLRIHAAAAAQMPVATSRLAIETSRGRICRSFGASVQRRQIRMTNEGSSAVSTRTGNRAKLELSPQSASRLKDNSTSEAAAAANAG